MPCIFKYTCNWTRKFASQTLECCWRTLLARVLSFLAVILVSKSWLQPAGERDWGWRVVDWGENLPSNDGTGRRRPAPVRQPEAEIPDSTPAHTRRRCDVCAALCRRHSARSSLCRYLLHARTYVSNKPDLSSWPNQLAGDLFKQVLTNIFHIFLWWRYLLNVFTRITKKSWYISTSVHLRPCTFASEDIFMCRLS